MPKVLLKILLLIVSTPITAVLLWYATSFFPYIDDIRNTPQTKKPLPSTTLNKLHNYAAIIETDEAIRSNFMSNAFRRLAYNTETTSQLSWQFNKVLWYLSSYLHFNDKEIFKMWASCAISGCGKGLPDAASKYFGKDITLMTNKDLVSLIAISKSPSFYTSSPSRFKQRIDHVWQQVKDKEFP